MDSGLNFTSEEKCCGCGACVQVCPKKCIKFVKNERGFLVLNVDKKQCISCDACIRVCPEIKLPPMKKTINSYAAISKERNIQKGSTSGGIFCILAKYVLKKEGLVIGVGWNGIKGVKHIVIEDILDLKKILQSKYVQSDTTLCDTFIKTKKALNNGKMVLFSGTGCQIAGLRSFLGKEFEKLITVEVICHGVPSPGLFEKYIEWLQNKNRKQIKHYSFRNKDKHELGEHNKLRITFSDNKKKYYYVKKDPYYNAFLNGFTLRKTCYHCKYKNKDRMADFTLGDFWGIRKVYSDFPSYYGCSSVLVNSKKAQEIFNKLSDQIIFRSCDKNYIYRFNKSVIQSCIENKKYIYNEIPDSLDDLFKKITKKPTLKEKIKSLFIQIIPYSVKYKIKEINYKKKENKI